MTNKKEVQQIIDELLKDNKKYQNKNTDELKKHVAGQNPKVTVLTCSDSRVVPEYIFNKKIGEIFVVRVAGNVAFDSSVITSLEYAVEHLKTPLLIILGHTHCGAVNAAESSPDINDGLIGEIRESFSLGKDHVLSNLKRQLDLIHMRSKVISDAIRKDELVLKGAIYYLDTGEVRFL